MTNIEKKHQEAQEIFFKQLSLLLSTAETKWDRDLYHKIETKCNFSPDYHYILFPGKESQIIKKFGEWQDQKMLELLAQEKQILKTREKIAKALEIRIMKIVSKTVILKQKALFLMPSYTLLGAKCYSQTCDLIWRYAGDKSDDFSYYSKRGLLLCVYTSACLFYLSDDSKEFIKTKEFIATSLESVINIAKIKNKLQLPSIEDIPILRLMS